METRRDFLQRIAAVAVTLALDPYCGVAVVDDIYTNERLGIRLRKPTGWDYSSIADFAALRDRQVLQTLLTDEPQPLKDPSNLPVVLIEDPHHRAGNFAPAIALWDEELQGDVPEDEPLAHKEVMIDYFAQTYRDVVIQTPPYPIALKGARGTRSIWSYCHELESGERYKMSICSIVVFAPPRVHTFHLGDSLTNKTVSERTWNDFINSIEYTG